MTPRASTMTRVLLLAIAAIAVGCSGSDGVTQPGAADTQADVQATAAVTAAAAPAGDAAGTMIAGMMGHLRPAPAPAPATSGGVAPAFSPPACEPTFDLGNGITGTCSVGEGDVVTFIFGGAVTVEGAVVSVEGTLVATPTIEQPATGSRYAIDLDATASSEVGQASWSLTGTIVVADSGEILDYEWTMTHVLNVTGGPASTATVHLDLTGLEVVVTGPRGNVARFVLDRTTMTGVITLNGFQVAVVTIADGCATVDFLNTELADVTVCSGD